MKPSDSLRQSSFLSNLKVGHKLSIIPSVYTFILIVIFVSTLNNARGLLLDSTIQDAVGRQRMLNEKYLQEVLLERSGSDNEREKTASLFLESLEALVNGGDILVNRLSTERVRVPRTEKQELLSLYEQQRALFLEMVRESDVFLAKPNAGAKEMIPLRDLSRQIFENTNSALKMATKDSNDNVNKMIVRVSILVLLATSIGVLISLGISRQITEPLKLIVEALLRAADGDLRQEAWESRIPGTDELGRLALSVSVMKSSLRSLIQETVDAANSLTTATAQVAASSQQQSASTAEQMAAVQETTATMEELEQTGHQVSLRARDVGASAESTSSASASGVEAVKSTYQIMEQIREQVQVTAENIVALSEKNKAVRNVVAVVNDIAERTNLLALNAAIEASSAGESGIRFSIVAEELKGLADQAKVATGEVRGILEDIEDRIHRSVMYTEEVVKRVEHGRREAANAEETIRELSLSTVDSVRAFQQIVASAGQQQIGFEQVVQALQNIRGASEQSSIGTRQLDEASASLSALAEQLAARSAQFKT